MNASLAAVKPSSAGVLVERQRQVPGLDTGGGMEAPQPRQGNRICRDDAGECRCDLLLLVPMGAQSGPHGGKATHRGIVARSYRCVGAGADGDTRDVVGISKVLSR